LAPLDSDRVQVHELIPSLDRLDGAHGRRSHFYRTPEAMMRRRCTCRNARVARMIFTMRVMYSLSISRLLGRMASAIDVKLRMSLKKIVASFSRLRVPPRRETFVGDSLLWNLLNVP